MTHSQETKQRAILSIAHHDFQKGLNSHAYFKVNDHSVGQDLVQETFLKTWRYIVGGGKIEIMKAFLYHALNCLIIDEYRKRKAVSLDQLLENGFEPRTTINDNLINLLDGRTAQLLIKNLPKKYRTIMRMRYTQDLTLEEISASTGLSRNTISVQAHRGLEKLKILYNRG